MPPMHSKTSDVQYFSCYLVVTLPHSRINARSIAILQLLIQFYDLQDLCHKKNYTNHEVDVQKLVSLVSDDFNTHTHTNGNILVSDLLAIRVVCAIMNCFGTSTSDFEKRVTFFEIEKSSVLNMCFRGTTTPKLKFYQ